MSYSSFPIPLVIHDVILDMSPIITKVGKNSTLMINLQKNPEKTLEELRFGVYSIDEINYQNEKKWTILHHLCRNAAKISFAHDLIEVLLNHPKIQINLKSDNNYTPLSLACYHSKVDSTEKTIEILLKHPDIDVNLTESGGWTTLMIAASLSNAQSSDNTVKMLLQHPKINVNFVNSSGVSALMLACQFSKTESTEKTVEMLLQHKDIDVNIQSSNDKLSALMYACDNARTTSTEKTVQMLLQHPNINVNQKDHSGRTVLIRSCNISDNTSNEKIVQMLLQHPNINVNLQTHNGWTALMMVCRYSSTTLETIGIIKLLLQHPKIDVNLLNNNNFSALMLVLCQTCYENIELLLSHKYININLSCNTGFSMFDYILIKILPFDKTNSIFINLNERGINLMNNDDDDNDYIYKLANLFLDKYNQTRDKIPSTTITKCLVLFYNSITNSNSTSNSIINLFDRECPVCFEYISDNDHILLPCKKNHHFHLKCIENWIFKDNFSIKNTKCPQCYTQFL